MSVIISATYDGNVIIPTERLNLAPNTKLTVLIQEIEEYPLDAMLRLSEETGIEDLSSNHDRHINNES